MHGNASRSPNEYALSFGCSVRDAKAIGHYCPSLICDKTAPRAALDASVETIVGDITLKSANTLLDAICLFSSSNACWDSSLQLNFASVLSITRSSVAISAMCGANFK